MGFSSCPRQQTAWPRRKANARPVVKDRRQRVSSLTLPRALADSHDQIHCTLDDWETGVNNGVASECTGNRRPPIYNALSHPTEPGSLRDDKAYAYRLLCESTSKFAV